MIRFAKFTHWQQKTKSYDGNITAATPEIMTKNAILEEKVNRQD